MYIRQFSILLAMLTVGYLVTLGLHLPLPANVIAMLLLLVLLLGRMKLSSVEKTADFIVEHLAIFFIAPTVGFMEYFDLLHQSFFKIIVPMTASLLVGYAVAGWVTQGIIRLQHKAQKEGEQ